MSQIEPYDYTPPFPPPDEDDDEQMWDYPDNRSGFMPGHPGQPGPHPGGWSPRPPGAGPWCKPPRPPVGWFPERWGKYQWPFWGHWGYRLRNAWKDVKYLTELIHDIVISMIDSGIIAPGPNSPVTGPSGGSSTSVKGPIIGITDGSDAAVGQVGEFITGTSTMPYTAYPDVTTQTVSPLVVSPGDWDFWASVKCSTLTGGVAMKLLPQPTGVSNDMSGFISIQSPTPGIISENLILISMTSRGNFSTPTLLPFQIQIDQANSSSLTAGTATLLVEGRRRR